MTGRIFKASSVWIWGKGISREAFFAAISVDLRSLPSSGLQYSTWYMPGSTSAMVRVDGAIGFEDHFFDGERVPAQVAMAEPEETGVATGQLKETQLIGGDCSGFAADEVFVVELDIVDEIGDCLEAEVAVVEVGVLVPPPDHAGADGAGEEAAPEGFVDVEAGGVFVGQLAGAAVLGDDFAGDAGFGDDEGPAGGADAGRELGNEGAEIFGTLLAGPAEVRMDVVEVAVVVAPELRRPGVMARWT